MNGDYYNNKKSGKDLLIFYLNQKNNLQFINGFPERYKRHEYIIDTLRLKN